MKRVDEVSRTIEASPEAIYRAFIDREALLAWLPPKGMSAKIDRFDARIGGGYQMVLTYADGHAGAGKSSETEDVVRVTFVALEENRRVAHDVEFESDAPEFAGTMHMTWAVSPEGDAARVTFTAEAVPPGISQDDHLAGLTASLDNLAEFVE